MSATQYYVAQSLDGYIAESDGGLDWLTSFGAGETGVSDATDGTYDVFYADVGAVAMGSATYEFLLGEELERWPYAGRPTWVFTSRTLPLPWSADVRFAQADVAELHDEMRAAAGDGNVWVVGGGHLAMQFVEAGLLDELIVTVVPVVLGAGVPTLPRRVAGQRLRLVGARPFANGMVELRYALGG